MKKTISKQSVKFLSFNNTNIYFVDINGINWIAIKPICKVLNIDHTAQYNNIKSHIILSNVYANQHMHDTKNRLQNMLCLPEKYIYGWIFSIQSKSIELKEYQKECYEILYNHFHGAITNRKDLLEKKAKAILEKKEILNNLKETIEYKEYLKTKREISTINMCLNKQDNSIVEHTIQTLFDQDFSKQN